MSVFVSASVSLSVSASVSVPVSPGACCRLVPMFALPSPPSGAVAICTHG